MKMIIGRPPAKQVHPLTAQFSSAGSGQDEASAAFAFDEEMNHFQKRGQLLDFVDDDLRAPRVGLDHFEQPLGPRGELPVHRGIEQVNPKSVGKLVLGPERLARPTGSEQEKVIFSRRDKSRKECHLWTQYGERGANCQPQGSMAEVFHGARRVVIPSGEGEGDRLKEDAENRGVKLFRANLSRVARGAAKAAQGSKMKRPNTRPDQGRCSPYSALGSRHTSLANVFPCRLGRHHQWKNRSITSWGVVMTGTPTSKR